MVKAACSPYRRSRRDLVFVESDAVAPRPILREPGAIVTNPQPQGVAVGLGFDGQRAAAHERFEPVADRVLDQRLQDQRRHQHVEGGRVDAVFDSQPRAEVDLLDVEVGPQVFQLLGQLHFLRADLPQA